VPDKRLPAIEIAAVRLTRPAAAEPLERRSEAVGHPLGG
jgi:hypothetical protein